MRALIVVVTAFALAPLPDQPLAPWGSNRHPTDLPKRHVEPITAGRHAYVIRQGGTMDGTNCRSPVGVGMMDGPAIRQTWESNRAVRLENVGETDVVNPWLSNGRNTFRTLGEIVSSAVDPGMTDREKAFALWFQEIRHRYHWGGDNNELGDPVKVFNVYGHNTCGNDSICLAGLWHRAGLKVTPARVVGHCVSQAFFDGRWNLFDGDLHSMYLLRDNRTVACEQDLVRDHDLVKRSHTQGILNPDRRATDEWGASVYVFEGKPEGDRNSATGTTMNMVLRPGESITWRWGHADPVKYHGDNKPRYPDMICNGLWEYRPDFSGDVWRKGAAAVEGIRATGGELTAADGKTGAVVWTVRSPYVFVGGRLEAEGTGVKFSLSWDGKSWAEAGPNLDKFFPPGGPARYDYRLRCELGAGARLKRLGIANDLQMAPLALPAMSVGENRFLYTDESPGGRKVRITHDWVERSASRPPAAPAAPAFPPDGGEAEGTDFTFRWLPAADPDGDRIADYHFELSERPDMKWPLSTNFYKLVSNTPDRGTNQYALPHAGLLACDQTYYWRVRAMDEKGVWGLWSPIWSFTPRGPSSPVEVTLAFDPDRNVGTLRWKPNTTGRRPARYRIYGSDEKGFSVSDEPFRAVVGASKEVPPTRPANFVTEVAATEATVIGADVNLPNANRAFYRVVAVDDKDNRSGPSDFAEASRPILSSRPVTAATVGSEYRYPLAVIRSLGDVRTRVVGGKETMGYWDIEAPRFALEQGPPWLTIDATTGLLSGVPDHPGKVAVVVTATIDRAVRDLDARSLSWGLEKVVSTGTQRVGGATQKFTIDVAPGPKTAGEPPPRKHTNVERLSPARLAAVHDDVQRLGPRRVPIPSLPGLNDYRCILHAHAEDSTHTGGTLPEMLADAKRAGVNAILLTDHFRPPRDFIDGRWRGLKDGVLFVPGSEVHGFLVYPMTSILDRMDLKGRDFINTVTSGDGMIFLSHVEERPGHPVDGLTGLEIDNRHFDAKQDRSSLLAFALKLTDPKQLAELQDAVRRYPDELLAFQCDYPKLYLDKWDEGTKQRRLTGVAANDCHHNQVFLVKMVDENTVLVGTNVDEDKAMRRVTAALRPGIKDLTRGRKPGDVLATVDVDPYFRSFRNSSTHVLASRLDEPAIRAALKAGHAYVAHDWMGDATGFRFGANDARGDRAAIMGDEVKLSDGLKLTAQLPLPAYLRLLRHGEEVATSEGKSEFEFAATQAGAYRLEAWLQLDGEYRLWIFANPVYVR